MIFEFKQINWTKFNIWKNLSFLLIMKPIKKIDTENLMIKWQKSQAYSSIVSFIKVVNSLIVDGSSLDAINVSENIESFVSLLECLTEKIDDFPPINRPRRFGNTAFTKCCSWLNGNLLELVDKYLFGRLNDKNDKIKAGEVGTYLLEEIGHPQRIDYWSGHELSFIAFLICLFDVKYLDATANGKADVANTALVVAPVYYAPKMRASERRFLISPRPAIHSPSPARRSHKIAAPALAPSNIF